jgi:hypothetical protein
VHLPNPGPHPGGPRFAALEHAARHPTTVAADWVTGLDFDGFVNIEVGDRSLTALLATLPEASAIVLTWRLFGSGGLEGHPEVGGPRTFTCAAFAVLMWPWRALMFKTLHRNDGTCRPSGIHRPRDPVAGRAARRWFDGSGAEPPEIHHAERLVPDHGGDHYRLAQVN